MPLSQPQWMQGFPPKRESVIRFDDGSFYQWPQFKWSVCNIQQLVPTKTVWRGDGAAQPLLQDLWPLQDQMITSEGGERASWQQVMDYTHTDGLTILHKGKLVHESYHGDLQAGQAHLIMSAAKSMVGVLAQMLIADGSLDADERVIHYLPELAQSAFADASVRQVLDMETSMVFDENYLDEGSEVWRYLRCGGMLPQQAGTWECLTDYLVDIQKHKEHGVAFAYREPNINVASWLLRRITGQHLNHLLSDMVWQHIGASHDGLYMLDPSGAETTMALTMRSFAQFGEWVRTHGHGQLDPAVMSELFAGGDPTKFAKAALPAMQGWSYKSLWWVRHMPHGNAICARGAHGQLLYIDPAKELVVAWCSSTQIPTGYTHDHWRMPLIDLVSQQISITSSASFHRSSGSVP